MGKRRIWYIVSADIIGLGIVSLVTKGLSFGIDFLGGTELVVQFQQPVEIGDVRTAMTNVGFGRAEIKTFGGDENILIHELLLALRLGHGVAECDASLRGGG